MKKKADANIEAEEKSDDGLLPEYDLAALTLVGRGKYASRYRKETNLVRLAPDVARAFPDDESVNEALRLLLKLAETQVKTSRRKSG